MRWLFRISLTLAFLGLALLAVWPYLPNLEKEWEGIYATWQQVREERAKGIHEFPEPKTVEPEPTPSRSRQLLTPDQPPTEPTNAVPSEADPFLAEARRRAESDPEAAMQWLQSQSTGAERVRGMLEVVALWAAEDSEAALLWLESNAQGIARMETLHNGVEVWAASDPAGAADWIDGMANDGSKVTAVKSLVTTWAKTDTLAAAAWVDGLRSGSIRDQAKSALATSWAQTDPEAASIWAFEQSEFIGGRELLLTTLGIYTEQAPDEAAAFIRDISEAAEGSELLIKQHVLTRAEQDPAETAAWLSSLSTDDPLYSPEYANSLMQVWAESDSISASAWLIEQPPGKQRDAAIAGFSETIQVFEPQAAATWANTISDPNRRVTQLTHSIRTWASSDPTSALEWVQSAELEPGLREQLARQIAAD